MDGLMLVAAMVGIFFAFKYAQRKFDESDKKYWEQ